MNSFRLKIVTPYGLQFDGEAEELVVRTTTGDLGILAGHISCVAPLGMGRATIITEGKRRYAACIGGMVSVVNGHVNLVPTTLSGRIRLMWSAPQLLRTEPERCSRTTPPRTRISAWPKPG